MKLNQDEFASGQAPPEGCGSALQMVSGIVWA